MWFLLLSSGFQKTVHLVIYIFIIYLLIYLWIYFEVGYIPSGEPNAGLELLILTLRPVLKSRVRYLTNRATQVPPKDLAF